MNIIEINNLNYSFKDKVIFENLNLSVKAGNFLFLVGPNGSGKTTLIKIISGLIDGNFDIKINNKLLKENIDIKKEIALVFDTPNNYFVAETVYEEISFSLKNLNFSKDIIKEKVENISKDLKIGNLLKCSPRNLSGGEQALVALASALVIEPKLLIIDEALSMLDNIIKNKILSYLKKINRSKKTTIIYITQDLEDTLYGKELAILNNKKIVIKDKIKTIFNNEKIFKENSLKLPFMADLSIKLKYYGLIDEIILDMDKMVNILWK